MKKFITFLVLCFLTNFAQAQWPAIKVINHKPVIIVEKTSECLSTDQASDGPMAYLAKIRSNTTQPCTSNVYRYIVKDGAGTMYIVTQHESIITGRTRYTLLFLEDNTVRLIKG